VKNIVLTGFGDITLLDLDTIDLSNLNRQFLFRKKDVKQSKALVCVPLLLFRPLSDIAENLDFFNSP
jgi:molybdopterin/thiamine biosynthesis adenylyltransferase